MSFRHPAHPQENNLSHLDKVDVEIENCIDGWEQLSGCSAEVPDESKNFSLTKHQLSINLLNNADVTN